MHLNSGILFSTFLRSRMTQYNTATLALEPTSILQIALSFFLTENDDKTMFMQESFNTKMSNRINKDSSLLTVKKLKLPGSYT